MPTDSAYFDAAFLFKLLWQEQGSNEVRAFAGSRSSLFCAVHGRAEVVATAHRKFREGDATRVELIALLDQFKVDCDAGGIRFLHLDDAVLGRVEAIFRSAPATAFVRAADALHLACAAENGFPEIYSNDRHLLAAAPLFGLKGIDVVAPP